MSVGWINLNRIRADGILRLQRENYRRGYDDGRAGRRAAFKEANYQRGWTHGQAQRRKETGL
jgi:hypothetical protein